MIIPTIFTNKESKSFKNLSKDENVILQIIR